MSAGLWLQTLSTRYNQRDRYGVAELFQTESSPSFQQFQNSLKSEPHQISYMDLTRRHFPEYRPLSDLAASFLLFSRDANLDSMDVQACAIAHQLMEDCYRGADKVFAQGETGWFVPTLRRLTRCLVTLAFKTDRISGDSQLTKASEAARMFGRPMSVATSDKGSESPSKRDALFFLANAAFKVYFALSNLRLCDTIITNTSTAAASLDSTYPKADRAAFSYYRGRILLYQRRLPQARQELLNAFNLCDRRSQKNGRLILSFLIAASLPLGIFPSETLMETFDLSTQYEDLLPALQLGDYRGVCDELDRHKSWHLNKGTYLLLKEKLEVVCWRNLIRRTLYVTTNGSPIPTTGPPTVSLGALLVAARMSFQDSTFDLDDVESMCASLLDQGYIKAYILHSKRLLVLQKGEVVGFPSMASVYSS